MRINKKYDFLLWDVDGTLLDFSYSARNSLRKCLEDISVVPTEEMIDRYEVINDGWWKRLERGEVTKSQLLTGRFEDFFREYGIACPDLPNFLKAYQTSLGLIYRYIEEAGETSLAICKRLQEMGYHQYAVTNGVTVTQEMKLGLSGFTEVFEKLFISEQLGAPKPQREFFDACFEELKQRHESFDKTKVLIIGDSLTSDIKGGANAGIHTCWYHPREDGQSGTPEVTYEIRSLGEIFEIV